MDQKLYLSTKTSIAIQFITLLIGIRGLLFTLPTEHQILQEVLSVEMIVQIVELLFSERLLLVKPRMPHILLNIF